MPGVKKRLVAHAPGVPAKPSIRLMAGLALFGRCVRACIGKARSTARAGRAVKGLPL